MKKSKKQIEKSQVAQPVTIVSKVFENGHMLEMLYALRMEKTAFAYWDGKHFEVKSSHPINDKKTYQPVRASNNLIKHGVIKLPSFVEDFGTVAELISEIRAFIHKYVDLEPDFEIVAAHYVLLTWVYDRFRELPYLRLTGDYGTGKTRFLLIIGSICYKPIFASGASTTSPIFHSLDSFNGTLVLDEADFRFSDAKSEITKILNNGNVKGFPVLRCQANSKGQYDPKAFNVYGPKIVATRGHYADPALESRFIHERSKAGNIRKDIPINLPDSFEMEADALRNKLLMYRFRNWHSTYPDKTSDMNIDVNRIAQIFQPLLAITQDDETKDIIKSYAQKSSAFLKTFRSHSPEEQVLSTIIDLMGSKLSIKAIATKYQSRYGNEYTNPITPKWIGSIIRSKLHLNTIKRQGIYIIPSSENPKLEALFKRYDINTKSTVPKKTTP